jgi:hypothetical protein
MKRTYAETETTVDLPMTLLREIGLIMILSARLEWMLSRFAYSVLGLDRTEGRIAVREPRGTDRLDMICQLLTYKSIESRTDLQELRADIDECERGRDRVAHGIWVRDPIFNTLRIVSTRGQWQPTPSSPPKTSRKIAPEGVEFDLPEARALSAKLQSTLAKVEQWADEFRPPQASQ